VRPEAAGARRRADADGFQVKRPRANMHGRLQHENFMDLMLKVRCASGIAHTRILACVATEDNSRHA
jgi:hypothetical protein